MPARLLLALCVGVLAIAPATARAAVPLTPCGQSTPGLQCGQVAVPLDRSGTTPGTISLHVEVLPATGMVRGAMFLVAGGPGQGSAGSFSLGSRDSADQMRVMFPGYTLVAFDNRGTGKSGILNCPALQSTVTPDADRQAALAGDCAAIIGPQRLFYATRDHVEDIEAVRTALGLGRIGLFGVSYGTKLSLAYAMAHPSAVERLLLDSVVPPVLENSFDANVLHEMPSGLRDFCAGTTCRGATRNFAGDIATLANRIERRPLRGKILAPGGRAKTMQVNGERLLTLAIDADLNPGIAAELPAAVRAALTGDARPLLRLADLDDRASVFPAEDLSFALNAATNCADGRFPWTPDTPVSARQALIDSAVGALPAGSFGPFGSWATRLGLAYFCKQWPSPAGNTPLLSNPLPNVPVLAVSGGFDVRTPTANARAVLPSFPQGQLLVVPGVGHSAVSADVTGCAAQIVRLWIFGNSIPRSCPRVPPLVAVLSTFPRGSARRAASVTLRDASKAVHEAEATWIQAIFTPTRIAPAGVYGGKLTVTQAGFTLTRYAIAPGFFLTGKLAPTRGGPPLVFKGTLRVSGPAATAGTLRINAHRVNGTLGGRAVSGRL